MNTFALAAVALACLASAAAVAAKPERKEYAGNITFENDLFFGTDRYYTDGVQFEIKRLWRPAPSNTPTILQTACRYIGCRDQPLLVSHYKVGQLMYTPERLSVHGPQPDDRPWAGMLYYTQDYNFLNAEGTALTTISGQIGILGPYSYAEQTQKWIHRTFTGVTPGGWDNQLGGEFGMMATLERRIALAEFSYAPREGTQLRATGHWRVALGNIMTFVGVGAKFVIGKDQPPVADRGPGIDMKIFVPDGRPGISRSCLFDWLECSASVSVEARLMARNIFLDGPMFRDGPSVNSRPFVVDETLSVRLDFPRTRSSFTGPWFVQFQATRRSPEFKSTKAVHSQSFGALTVGVEF